ncbi:sortase family protein [Nonomuraea polychroma]|uniref:Sortase family protein n=1 Tax=Nonomuraea polychroma TaxID=46176 RepID=A0A438MER6_9ACTN|nr:sortase family protein [Nonomuraea polychroma]
MLPALAAVLGAAALIAMSSWPRSAAPAVPAPAPAIAATVPVAAIPRVPASPPVRVEIPEIDVRAKVMKLGLGSDGTLEVPPLSKADQTGWYERGAAPGTAGPTVIVGHVDTADGPAVFYRLGELRPGDRVRVTRADGRVATFQLDALESVRKDAFPTQRVYGDVAYPAIRLITCGGDFDGTSGHYRNNIIAYGHLVSIT